jgi:hypothetical protein
MRFLHPCPGGGSGGAGKGTGGGSGGAGKGTFRHRVDCHIDELERKVHGAVLSHVSAGES